MPRLDMEKEGRNREKFWQSPMRPQHRTGESLLERIDQPLGAALAAG